MRAVYKWARGHAKSTHMDVMIPMWLHCQKERELNVMVIVGKSEDNAKTLLGDIQAELQFNQRYIYNYIKHYDSELKLMAKNRFFKHRRKRRKIEKQRQYINQNNI